MYGNDPDDEFTRFRRRLQDRRQELVAEVVAGGCDQPLYQNYCGKIAMIDEAVELLRTVRRGEDLRPPPAREPLLSPEE